jgi:hypothetical protein
MCDEEGKKKKRGVMSVARNSSEVLASGSGSKHARNTKAHFC